MNAQPSVLVLGIGNLLWADEGFGVRAAEEFGRRFEHDERVTLMDGGTQGLYLLPHVQAATHLIVFDAIDYGLEPGTLKVVVDGDVPAFMGVKKMSLHQTGFQDVLAAAQLTGQCPAQLVLIGVQPAVLDDYGGSLRDVVRAQLGPACDTAAQWLLRWDIRLARRAADGASGINAAALSLASFEDGRPAEHEACRIGDARFLRRGPDRD